MEFDIPYILTILLNFGKWSCLQVVGIGGKYLIVSISEQNILYILVYNQLRDRRALVILNDGPLRTRRVLLL